MKNTVIAVVGGKSSGKTTTIEVLIRELTKRGYKIAAIKHISEANFTIDTRGKDTWRFAQSGAQTIVGVASDEIVTIEKMNTKNLSLNRVLEKCEDHDAVLLEGFKEIASKNKDIPKIVTVKSAKEAQESVKRFVPILAFAGPYSTENLGLNIPYVDVLRNPEKIADTVEKVLKERR